MKWFLFITMALSSSWEELQQLVQRGSWNQDAFYSFLFWTTDWRSIWSVFDSHHVAFGLFVLLFIMLIYKEYHWKFFNLKSYLLTEALNIGILFIGFFWIRNIGMHILFCKPEFIKWIYLSPITF